jgi:hypothetical protein
MASETKTPAAPPANKPGNDRRRLSYLKTRFKEVREELQAIKTEMTNLKKNVVSSKSAGAKAKDAAGDDDDED